METIQIDPIDEVALSMPADQVKNVRKAMHDVRVEFKIGEVPFGDRKRGMLPPRPLGFDEDYQGGDLYALAPEGFQKEAKDECEVVSRRGRMSKWEKMLMRKEASKGEDVPKTENVPGWVVRWEPRFNDEVRSEGSE